MNFAFASPSVQIISPENTTYYTNKILVNVTANETVDFYIQAKTKPIVLARNTTKLESYIYGKTGTYKFTVFANNSHGTANDSVVYSIDQHNPVHISTGGGLMSSNTEYVLDNDIDQPIYWYFPVENITLNLNGRGIYSDMAIGAECSYSRVHNGTLHGTWSTLELMFSYGCIFDNLNIYSDWRAVQLWNVKSVTFDRINLTAVIGFGSSDFSANMILRDSEMHSLGDPDPSDPGSDDVAFNHEWSGPDVFTVENTNITDFTRSFVWSGVSMPEYIMRNSAMKINESNMDIYGPARIYRQHLVIINTTDDSGMGVPVVVQISDNNTETAPYDSELLGNPTSTIFVATNDSGLAQTWLTEKVTVYRIESPLKKDEKTFSPYKMTAKTRDTNVTIWLNVVSNSTFRVPIEVPFPSSGTLPACTLSQMLDLNNDGVVNTKDALVILRTMVGKSVQINSTKECNAISFFPVN